MGVPLPQTSERGLPVNQLDCPAGVSAPTGPRDPGPHSASAPLAHAGASGAARNIGGWGSARHRGAGARQRDLSTRPGPRDAAGASPCAVLREGEARERGGGRRAAARRGSWGRNSSSTGCRNAGSAADFWASGRSRSPVRILDMHGPAARVLATRHPSLAERPCPVPCASACPVHAAVVVIQSQQRPFFYGSPIRYCGAPIMFCGRAATLTALLGAPHFPSPHLKGAGFSSRRPSSTGLTSGGGQAKPPPQGNTLRQNYPQQGTEIIPAG